MWVIWCFTKNLCMRCDAWVGELSWWRWPSPVAHACCLLNHPNSFRRGMFKLNAKFDADLLFYQLSQFWIWWSHSSMLTQWGEVWCPLRYVSHMGLYNSNFQLVCHGRHIGVPKEFLKHVLPDYLVRHINPFSLILPNKNDNSQHNNSYSVWMNQSYTYIFCQLGKLCFLVCHRILVISLCVLWDEEGWKLLLHSSKAWFWLFCSGALCVAGTWISDAHSMCV